MNDVLFFKKTQVLITYRVLGFSYNVVSKFKRKIFFKGFIKEYSQQ